MGVTVQNLVCHGVLAPGICASLRYVQFADQYHTPLVSDYAAASFGLTRCVLVTLCCGRATQTSAQVLTGLIPVREVRSSNLSLDKVCWDCECHTLHRIFGINLLTFGESGSLHLRSKT